MPMKQPYRKKPQGLKRNNTPVPKRKFNPIYRGMSNKKRNKIIDSVVGRKA